MNKKYKTVTTAMLDVVGTKIKDILKKNPDRINFIVSDICELYQKDYSVLQIVQVIRRNYD